MTISNLTKMVESYPNGWKTQWEKETLLVKRWASKGVIVWEWD